MNKKENSFFSFVKALIIILFISGCTVGGVFVGQKLAEKNFNLSDNSLRKENDEASNTENKVENSNNCLTAIENVNFSSGNFYSVSYTFNKAIITASKNNILSASNENNLSDGIISGAISFDKIVSSIGVFSNVSSDNSERVFIIYEDGSVKELTITVNGDIKENDVSMFNDYKIKTILEFNYDISNAKLTANVTLLDGSNVEISNK